MRRLVPWLALLAVACAPAAPGVDAGLLDAGLLDAGLFDAGTDAGVDAGPPLPAPPATLAETGLFAAGVEGAYADGVRSYDVRFPLWTDGAEKRRHLVLPAGGQIDTSDPNAWSFPEGTRVFKEFIVEGANVETRMLWKTGPDVGSWVYVAYRYRPDGSDADPIPEGQADVLGTMHDVPAVGDCRNCHRGAADFVIGLEAMQLDRATFDAWTTDGALPPGTVFGEPPGDETQRAALGYLHGNCGHCHSDVHPLAMNRDLRLYVPVGLTDPWTAPAWDTGANVDAFHDIEGARAIIEVGDPMASQLWVRMGLRDERAMPPLGTEQIDVDARATIAAWITGAAP